MYSIRTDLAIEAREIYKAEQKDEVPGVFVEKEDVSGVLVTRVKITTDEGAKALDKAIGTYITLEIPDISVNNAELFEAAARAVSDEINKLAGKKDDRVTLVAGLGNREITPDSLGPRVVSSLVVTRHLFHNMPESIPDTMSSVCAMAPSVLGLTGIETGEIVKGVSARINPDLIIAVDALMSRAVSRVCTTIQITDTGISPGSGVGNRRKALDKSTLGVPVIAIGVPMVVDAATIANDSIDRVIDVLVESTEQGGEFYRLLKSVDREEKYRLIKETISSPEESLIVTPKEIDKVAERMAKIVANGINYCLHENITAEEIDVFIN